MEWKHAYERIIRIANTAPSGDNLHPWIFEVSREKIDVFFVDKDDEDRVLFRINPLYPGDAISFGALAENLKIAATERGIHVDIVPGKTGDKMFTARISEKRVPEDPLFGALRKRSTDRRAYLNEKVSEDILAAADTEAKSFQGEILWLIHEKEKQSFASLAASFENFLWGNISLRRHIGNSFRFHDEEKDGIHPEHMGLGWKKYFFPFFFSLVKRISALYRVMGFISSSNSRNLVRHSSAIGFLVMKGPFSARKTYIDGGRALERIWLSFAKNGVAVQPLYGLAGTKINELLKVGRMSFQEQKWQKEAIEKLEELFPRSQGKTPIILFRVGYPKGNKPPASPRRAPIIIWK